MNQALFSALTTTEVPAPGIRLWSLGQAGIAIRDGSRLVLVDPYLSDWLEQPSEMNPEPVTRFQPPPMTPEEVPEPDVVLCTHEHPDHLDPGTIAVLAERSTSTVFVVPLPLVGDALALGVPDEQLIGVRVDQPFHLPGVDGLALPAAHAFHAEAFGGYTYWLDDAGDHRAVGYVLTIGGVRIFHSGDTVFWPQMDARLAELEIDVGILPVNGRDWKREREGLVGNLTAREAADLAAAARFGLVVPCHYDGIVGNTGDLDGFVRYLTDTYPDQDHAIPAAAGLEVRP